MLDLLIRGGTVVDGSGAPAATGDIGIRGGRIAALSLGQRHSEPARRVIDADGLLVTPGWVDVHTHYDGQATWDSLLTPSCWHGVTTVVMGNCGVGFAPVRPGQRDYLIRLMEGVEDIPGTALAEGIQWAWESFPEYLDALEGRPRSLDVAAQLPHAALRFYVMGERGADHSAVPSASEIAAMRGLAREAMEAGALGFSTSRTRNHRASDGSPTPSLTASHAELVGICQGLAEAGQGVMEVVSDFVQPEAEWELLRDMVRAAGRPLSVSLAQNDARPDGWRGMLAHLDKANEEGLPLKAQVPVRAIGLMLGLEASLNPFVSHPSFRPLQELPLAERVARLRQPALRRALLSEQPHPGLAPIVWCLDRLFELGDPPDYEQPREKSIAARAAREGRPPEELALDLLLQNEGRTLLYRPFLNYTDYDLEVSREMLLHPHAVPGLGDAGAHCGMICDGSFPSYLLTHWARDRTRGSRIALEQLIKGQCADTAALVGLRDRGLIAPGMKADLNLIDFEGLRLHAPEILHDLPAGGKRLIQRVEGYEMTLVSGMPSFERGEHTGALPGGLVRGAQPGPSAVNFMEAR